MKKKRNLYILLVVLFAWGQAGYGQQLKRTGTPPMGWNSFDSYGVYLHEKAALDNLAALATEYRQFGYDYFVIDNGWFGEYKLRPGTIYSMERHASDVHINEYGLLQPSVCYFPNGFSTLIAKCHEQGLKFGLHLMRGIPRKAVEQNLPIQGTDYRARDIADTTHVCNWCRYNYGVDMSKPGAQAFYNSLINQLASWGVDFIKVDDIVPYPDEVAALVRAVEQCGRKIVISLSPGDRVPVEHIGVYQQSDMLRVTGDVWDTQRDIDNCFTAWKKWSGIDLKGLWVDMDMIPFGNLQLMSPRSLNKEDISKSALYAGRGYSRTSELNREQMKTFITMRALSASPLMIGGDLPTMDDFSRSLLTNPNVIACNQLGKVGKLIYEMQGLEVWKVEDTATGGGWIGIFNRTALGLNRLLKLDDLKLPSNLLLKDVWNQCRLAAGSEGVEVAVPGQGVVFVRYDLNDKKHQ